MVYMSLLIEKNSLLVNKYLDNGNIIHYNEITLAYKVNSSRLFE